MPTRAQREEVLRREREALKRGDLSPEEKAAFASEQRRKDAEAWRRIRPQPQLELPERADA